MSHDAKIGRRYGRQSDTPEGVETSFRARPLDLIRSAVLVPCRHEDGLVHGRAEAGRMVGHRLDRRRTARQPATITPPVWHGGVILNDVAAVDDAYGPRDASDVSPPSTSDLVDGRALDVAAVLIDGRSTGAMNCIDATDTKS